MNDAKDYVTNPRIQMYWIDDPEHPPPMNKTLLLTNEGKVLDKGKLTPDNISHFLHWMEMPVLPKTKPWLEKNAVANTDTASLPASGNDRGQALTGQNVHGTEARVCADIADRQALGMEKYGVSVADNPLSLLEWMKHEYEEQLDAVVYKRRQIEELEKLIEKWGVENVSQS